MKTRFLISLFMIISLFITSCTSSSNGSSSKDNQPMKYSLSVSSDIMCVMTFSKPSLGVVFHVFECAENGDKIFQKDVPVEAGNRVEIISQSNTKKVKVNVSYYNVFGDINNRSDTQGWLPLVYYLSPDKTTEINFDNHTNLWRNEP